MISFLLIRIPRLRIICPISSTVTILPPVVQRSIRRVVETMNPCSPSIFIEIILFMAWLFNSWRLVRRSTLATILRQSFVFFVSFSFSSLARRLSISFSTRSYPCFHHTWYLFGSPSAHDDALCVDQSNKLCHSCFSDPFAMPNADLWPLHSFSTVGNSNRI